MEFDHRTQPDLLHIDGRLRLRKPERCDFKLALPWYEETYIMEMSIGSQDKVYGMKDIEDMYHYLSTNGELYFIEILSEGSQNNQRDEQWKAIGDVTLMEHNLPIVICQGYRGLGIGKKVLLRIIGRGIELGMTYFKVPEVYLKNIGSQRLYQSLGFKELGRNDQIISYFYEI